MGEDLGTLESQWRLKVQSSPRKGEGKIKVPPQQPSAPTIQTSPTTRRAWDFQIWGPTFVGLGAS